jgi:glycine cleavage system H lipoate-binding protein
MEPEMELCRAKLRSSGGQSPCIWMQAGVIARKFCENDYDCASCSFDKALLKAADQNQRPMREGRAFGGKRGRIISWKEKLRQQVPAKRPCIHHMKGRIEFRACHHDYRCGNCEFDQFFRDQFAVHAVVKPVNPLEVKGFRIPQGYYFHRGHTWMKVEQGTTVRVGIDEFALRLLGPFDRIESPLLGREVCRDQLNIVAFRGGLRADILSPVDGVVTAINPRLRENGRLASDEPYSEGWVMNVHSTNLRRDLKNLMIHKETEAFMEAEVNDLYRLIEEVAGPLSADGGYLGRDIYGNMPALGWERLTRTFLRSGLTRKREM